MYHLDGKVAIVTGAGSGIGRAIAIRLSLEGVTLVAADLNGNATEKLIGEIKSQGGRGLSFPADMTNEKDVERMVKTAVDQFAQIDILVNNAGGGASGRVVDYSEKDWEKTIQINLKSTFLCCREVGKVMIPRKQGRIINISSVSGKSGEEFIGAYAAAKFGVIGLTQTLAKELGRSLINVNTVCPGYVWTPGWEAMAQWIKDSFAAQKDKSLQEIFDQKIKSVVPLRRPQTPEDIACLVAFLASDEARNITGQAINVDGGAVMR